MKTIVASLNPDLARDFDRDLLRRRDLLGFVARRPGIALAITRSFARRLREAITLVEDLAFRDVTSRLAKILLEGQHGDAPRRHDVGRPRLPRRRILSP